MASAAKRLRPSRQEHAVSRPRTERALAWYGHLLGTLAFSAPFLGLGLWAQRGLFLSQDHARLVTTALVAIDRNRPESIFSSYSLLSFLLALLKPSPLTLSLGAGLAAGAMAWVLWNDLLRAPLGFMVRLALWVTLVATPAMAFLATQSLSAMLLSLLFLLAWRSLYDFVARGRVWSGFVAGMFLGAGFYAGFYALAWGLLCALALPWAAPTPEASSARERREALFAKMLVIAFPPLMALASWAYLNWLANGDPWRFLRDLLSGTLADLNRAVPPTIGPVVAIRETGHELLRLPLYLSVGLIIALKAPKWLPLYLVPIVSVVLLRALGFHFPEALTLSTCTLMALVALSHWPLRRWGVILATVALIQVALSVALPARDQELVRWRAFLIEGRPLASDMAELEVAAHLRQATPHSILTEDRRAYRLIARAGTARPFVLPEDALFELAVSDPLRRVKYLLVDAEEGGLAAFGAMPPAGFVLEGAWSNRQLYRSQAAPPLINPATSSFPHVVNEAEAALP